MVEDDEFSAMVVCEMLRQLGYRSTLVTLGAHARCATAGGSHAVEKGMLREGVVDLHLVSREGQSHRVLE